MCNSGPRAREAADVGSRKVDAVRTPDVVVEPAERVEVLDRCAAVEVAAVRLLLDRLGEMGVQHQPEPARELCGRAHQLAGDRERRARGDGDLHQTVLLDVRKPLGVGEDVVQRLDERVGR